MIKFSNVLEPEQLSNIEVVKSYLEFSFRARKAQKDQKLYQNIALIYQHFPKLISELLVEIPKIGYYKDYFYLLIYAEDELSEKIYNIVIEQLKIDLENYKRKGQITTLGKWLPREASKINKKTGFVDKFGARFFGGSLLSNRIKYRKMKVALNAYIGTLEVHMCMKTYDKIDFEKVSPYAFKINRENLLKHEECKDIVEGYSYQVLKVKNMMDLMKFVIVGGCVGVDEVLLERVWGENKSKYLTEIPYLGTAIEKGCVCILDLSKDVVNFASWLVVGIGLLVLEFNGIVFCGNVQLTIKGNIVEKVKGILKHCGPYRNISFTGIEQRNIIIVSNKLIELQHEIHKIVQYAPNIDGSYYVKFHHGGHLHEIKKECTLKAKNNHQIVSRILGKYKQRCRLYLRWVLIVPFILIVLFFLGQWWCS